MSKTSRVASGSNMTKKNSSTNVKSPIKKQVTIKEEKIDKVDKEKEAYKNELEFMKKQLKINAEKSAEMKRK